MEVLELLLGYANGHLEIVYNSVRPGGHEQAASRVVTTQTYLFSLFKKLKAVILLCIVGAQAVLFPNYARRVRPRFFVSPDIPCPVLFLSDYFNRWADFTRGPIKDAYYSIRAGRDGYGSSYVKASVEQQGQQKPLWISNKCETFVNVEAMGCGATLKAVLLHEVGHCLGLAHSLSPNSMMNFSVLLSQEGLVIEPVFEPRWMRFPSPEDMRDLDLGIA